MNQKNIEDIQLITKVINGCRKSEELLYNKYRKLITNFINRSYPNDHDVEDDASDILMKIIENLRSYDPNSAQFNTWVMCITKNHMIDKFKKIKYIICHFGSESVFNELKKINDKFNQLLDLVLEKSNIWIETSSVHYNYNKEEYPFAGSCKLIEKAYGIIGPEKIIWGTDYPAILAFVTYGQLTNYIVKGCKKIPDKDKEMIMGKNALNIFWP